MTNIIAFSGKKQAGKSASANFLFALEMVALQTTDGAFVDKEGLLRVVSTRPDVEGGLDIGVLDPCSRRPEVQQWFIETGIWPTIKLYSFAEWLKTIATEVLGLTDEQVYGTDEQKNSLTHLKWEDMPGVVTQEQVVSLVDGLRVPLSADLLEVNWPMPLDPGGPDVGGKQSSVLDQIGVITHSPGRMTGREVMQHLGTEIFRKMYYDVWAKACIRKIQKEKVGLAIITDCRFPNEVEAVQEAGGKVVRLTRDIFKGEDQHPSETALDPENFDWDKFDAIIDNSELSLAGQNELVFKQLMSWGVISDTEDDAYDKTQEEAYV